MSVYSYFSRDPAPPSGGDVHVEHAVYREVARSRRSGSPVAVVVVRASEGGRRFSGRPSGRHADRTAVLVRRYDQVVARHAQRLVVIAPDASSAGAAVLADRLRSRLGCQVGTACFPDDAATADELLGLAERRARVDDGRSRYSAVPTQPTSRTDRATGDQR